MCTVYISPHFICCSAFGGCIVVSCVMNFILPILIAKDIYGAVIAVRILQGMSEVDTSLIHV